MRELRFAVVAVLATTVVLGLAYPLAMTGAAQVLWPQKADGEPTLVAKDYSKDDALFQARPSATGYSTDPTAFNNQGPNQKALAAQLERRLHAYLTRERPFTPGLTAAQVPPDAVTSSASGIDPQISEANARIQANRVAAERHLPLARVMQRVAAATSRPLFGLAGPKSVNVVQLNDALEAL
jgi:potassium-transporting ATPase KdpC subunit